MAAIKTKRSETALMKRLRKVVDECTAYIARDELRGWYNTGALRPGENSVFSDINERWRELTSGERGRLLHIKTRTGFVLFAMHDVTLFGTDTRVQPHRRGRVV
jgi:hypothetical protein